MKGITEGDKEDEKFGMWEREHLEKNEHGRKVIKRKVGFFYSLDQFTVINNYKGRTKVEKEQIGKISLSKNKKGIKKICKKM